MKKVDPPKIGHFRGGLLSSLFPKMLHSKSRFFRGPKGVKFQKFFLGSKIILKNSNFGERIFLIRIGRKKLWPLSLFC